MSAANAVIRLRRMNNIWLEGGPETELQQGCTGALFNLLACNSTLTALDVTSVDISCDDAQCAAAVAAAIGGNTGLRFLAVAGVRCGWRRI